MDRLISLAEKYETAGFIVGDPSWFMHQVSGRENQETMAFIASSLSYGSRKQFLPKIQFILDAAKGNVYDWVKNGAFNASIPDNPDVCFYRLYTERTMNHFLRALQELLNEYGSLGEFVQKECLKEKTTCFHSSTTPKSTSCTAIDAVDAFCRYFSAKGVEGIIPKNSSSACKRVCMFLRWMVRDGSPVDLGLWSDIIDKRTLIMPLDTHVLQEAVELGLLKNKTASMSVAQRLTAQMLKIFPDDPLKGDFALFGYGVNK